MTAELLATAQQFRLPAVNLDDFDPDRALLEQIPLELAQEHKCFPLALSMDRLLLACGPGNVLHVQDFFSRVVGREVLPVLAAPAALDAAIARFYLEEGYSSARLSAKALVSVQSTQVRPQQREEMIDKEAPVADLVNHMLREAVRQRASDIHLEPCNGRPKLRYRVDGALVTQPPIPPDLYPALVARIKIIANLDIAERRRPQDGRAVLTEGHQSVDLRVSIIPMLEGEGVVIRVLGSSHGPTSIESINFSPAQRREWLRLANQPHGIVLVTGPTGSGKTTTLYSTLRAIQTEEKKIVTLEDPVEAKLDGIAQIPIRSDLGFDFAKGLRSVLRHDPDVMLLGEIRDLETATIAVQASLTGHLLFATLHTNSAAQAVARLLDMGLAGYQVMTALTGVLAQRLMRKLCDHCKTPVEVDPVALGMTQTLGRMPLTTYKPCGCGECSGIGYRGRLPVFELLTIDSRMRRLRDSELQAETLEAMARETGFVSLAESGAELVKSGQTSLTEYLALFGDKGE